MKFCNVPGCTRPFLHWKEDTARIDDVAALRARLARAEETLAAIRDESCGDSFCDCCGYDAGAARAYFATSAAKEKP